MVWWCDRTCSTELKWCDAAQNFLNFAGGTESVHGWAHYILFLVSTHIVAPIVQIAHPDHMPVRQSRVQRNSVVSSGHLWCQLYYGCRYHHPYAENAETEMPCGVGGMMRLLWHLLLSLQCVRSLPFAESTNKGKLTTEHIGSVRWYTHPPAIITLVPNLLLLLLLLLLLVLRWWRWREADRAGQPIGMMKWTPRSLLSNDDECAHVSANAIPAQGRAQT